MKKIILLLPLLFVLAFPANAQGRIPFRPVRPKTMPTVPRVAPRFDPIPSQVLPTQLPKQLPLSAGANVPTVPPPTILSETKLLPTPEQKIILPPMPGTFVQYPFLTVRASKSPRNQRPIWQRLSRNIQAAKLKKQRARDAATAQAKARLPKLDTETALVMQDLHDVLPFMHPQFASIPSDIHPAKNAALPLTDIPPLPFMEEANVAFRGMALVPNDIIDILDKGLLLDKVSAKNGRRNLALAAGQRGYLTHFSKHPPINATPSPESAAYWGVKNLELEHPLLVITKIKDIPNREEIINIAQDIPASQIDELIVLLGVDQGQTRKNFWFRIERHDGGYKITPYKRNEAALPDSH